MSIELARRYLHALERRSAFADLAPFFAPDFVQEEFPNRLMPRGARRDLAAIRAAAELGSQAVKDERYDVISALQQGDTVVLEVAWSACLLKPFGTLAAGDTMRARFAMFLTLREGRLASQRNYDCFDPF